MRLPAFFFFYSFTPLGKTTVPMFLPPQTAAPGGEQVSSFLLFFLAEPRDAPRRSTGARLSILSTKAGTLFFSLSDDVQVRRQAGTPFSSVPRAAKREIVRSSSPLFSFLDARLAPFFFLFLRCGNVVSFPLLAISAGPYNAERALTFIPFPSANRLTDETGRRLFSTIKRKITHQFFFSLS